MRWPLTLLPKTLSPRFHPCCSCFPATAAVPVSGSSYPIAIGLFAPAELPVPPELLELPELQAARASNAASRSVNVPYRADLPRTLMTSPSWLCGSLMAAWPGVANHCHHHSVDD